MKKTAVLIFIISLIISVTACTIPDEQEEQIDKFEIYLATTASVREFGYFDYENLIIEGNPLITGDDVRNYFWDQHILELNAEFLKALKSEETSAYELYDIDPAGVRIYNTGGSRFLNSEQFQCFVVVVNDRKVYSGTFREGNNVVSQNEELIIGDISDDRLAVIYSGEGFDTRNSDAVYDYFSKVGKLGEMTVNDSEDIIKSLEDSLSETTASFLELKTKYNELLENLTVDENVDTDTKDALIRWLNNRLKLYIDETQEGTEHEMYSERLLMLDLTDIESISLAADIFRQSAVTDDIKNDRMFNVFEELYYTIIENVPLNYGFDVIEDNEFKALLKANWVTVDASGGSIKAYPTPGALRENFGIFLSTAINDYLVLLDEERELLLSSGTVNAVNDGQLEISMDSTAELIYKWKNFPEKYPYSYPFIYKAMDKADYYLGIYMGKTELKESPVYDLQTMEIKEEAGVSYERFIENYPDSPYHTLIKAYYNLLKMNSFIYSQTVDEFVNSIDFADYR